MTACCEDAVSVTDLPTTGLEPSSRVTVTVPVGPGPLAATVATIGVAVVTVESVDETAKLPNVTVTVCPVKVTLSVVSFAEYVTVATAVGIAKLPAEIDFADGGVLGLAGVAAITAIDRANIQPGQVVLIAGATGGVGNQALQLAVKAGAHVIATAASTEEKQLVTDLGASETVDYNGPFATDVRSNYPDGVDVVLHFAGDAGAALAAVRKGGAFVSTLVMSPEQLPTRDATVLGVYANPDEATLNRSANNHAKGVTRVHIERTYSLDKVPDALAAFAAGTLGKLAVTIA